ncbi:MAG: UvrB/UvrC motif-containing protein [Clostridiales bacterium]|nr:UvrB/UvrC motif-containing protein [Clostridiales bacterium]
MLCQNCGKNEATTHIKRVINGKTSESHLCSECAASLGYDNVFGGFGFSLGDFLGGFLSDAQMPALTSSETVRCGKCGNSWRDIVRDGQVGCADCYRTFFDELQPSLQRIHGRIRHNGKAAHGVVREPKEIKKTPEEIKDEKIQKLKKELDDAVAVQNFELAAKLRDEIKELG